MHLRGISEAVERLAKMEAARRGISLSEFVSEAIVAATRGYDDQAEHERIMAPLAEERAWYHAHRAEIERDYAGQVVVIWKSGVIATGATMFEAYTTASVQTGNLPVYMVDLTVPKRRPVILRSREHGHPWS